MSARRATRALLAIVAASAITHARPARADDAVEACAAAAEQAARAVKASRFGQARTLLARCLDARCPALLQHDCAELERTVSEQEASVVLRVTRDGKDCRASVAVDGAPSPGAGEGKVVALDPGEHDLAVSCEGAVTRTMHVLVRAGERTRPVEVPLVSAAAPDKPVSEPEPPRQVLPFVLAAAGVATLGAGTVFAVSALDRLDDLRGTCSPRCTSDETRSMYTRGYVADGLFVVGGGLLLASAIVWFTGRPARVTASGAPAFVTW